MKDFTARIDKKSERAQDWEQIFGTDEINIKSPIPIRVNVPNHPNTLAYELDLKLITKEQKARLIEHIARRFNIPKQEVEKDLESIGVPILTDDVIVTVHNPQKWI
jgi:hypothetical protein